jgi:hypothetical protein
VFDYAIDSFHSLKISPSLGYQQTINNSLYDYEQFGSDGRQSNNGYSNSINNSTASDFRNDLLFRKKFRRKGRTFSVSLQTTLNNSDGDGSLKSVNQFFAGGATANRTDSINQRFTNNGDLLGYNARVVYTEPVFKRSLMEFSVGRSNTTSTAEKITYDYNDVNGKYDQLNDSLTNDFENTYGYSSAGLRLRTKRKNITMLLALPGNGPGWRAKLLRGSRIL